MDNTFNSFDKLPEAINYIIAEIAEIKKLLIAAQTTSVSNKRIPIGINEVCLLLKKAKPTIYSLVQKRILPYYKTGKNLYFYEDEILVWLESSRIKTLQECKNEKQRFISNNRW